MSFPLKLLIAVAVWLVFYLLTLQGCREELCFACDEAVPESTADTLGGSLSLAQTAPIYFLWSDTTAYTNDNLDSLKAALLARRQEGELLEITGLYYEAEDKPQGHENMGLARAAAVSRLFGESLPAEERQQRARRMEETGGERDEAFEGVAFEWVSSKTSATVEDIGDRILIRFPVGSTQKVYDAAVDEYLKKLSERVTQTGERVQLTGHTDNTGSDEANMQLGQGRANAIQQILAGYGVPEAQIQTSSEGESEPVASNATEEGRYENRRVEVRLIKQPSKNEN